MNKASALTQRFEDAESKRKSAAAAIDNEYAMHQGQVLGQLLQTGTARIDKIFFDADEALALARWLVDTFGDQP